MNGRFKGPVNSPDPFDNIARIIEAYGTRAEIGAGATGLKIFPASLLGRSGVTAIRAVLPSEVPLVAVGGVRSDGFAAWHAAGISGFGLGSSLFKLGKSDGAGRKGRQYCRRGLRRPSRPNLVSYGHSERTYNPNIVQHFR